MVTTNYENENANGLGSPRLEVSSKFGSALAERLYGETPDHEIAHEGTGWFGFYSAEHILLYENTDGFVYQYRYETKAALDRAWEYAVHFVNYLYDTY